MAAAGFLGGSVGARIAALLDDGTAAALDPAGAGAVASEGKLLGRAVLVYGTDPAQASGAIGRADADLLVRAIAHALERRLPLILVLDSAGAKLTEGVPVLGAFRRLQCRLLEAAATGMPIVSVVGRHCYGGASLIAFSAGLRIYPRESHLGLSGPRALAALQPQAPRDGKLDALFSAESRARHDEQSVLVADAAEAVRATLAAWLHEHRGARHDLATTQRALTRRLRMYRGNPYSLGMTPPPPELEARLDHLFPQGWSALYGDGVVQGDGWVDGRNTCFAGFVGGRTVDAFGAWRFAEALRAFQREPAGMPVTLLLDSPGQSSAIEDEQVVLSEFVTQIAIAAFALRAQGRSVELWMIGEAGGAIYVALAAAATTVTGWPGLKLQTLPARAVDQVVGAQPEGRQPLSVLLESRVIDRWTRSPGFGEWPAPSMPS